MPSFFADMKYKMPPVPEDKRIETQPFLLAAAEILPFLGEHYSILKVG